MCAKNTKKIIIPFAKQIIYLPPEKHFGNTEYKWKLTNISNPLKYQKLATQMKFRLHEGEGRAVYLLGVMDDGKPVGISHKDLYETITSIRKAVKIIEACVCKFHLYRGEGGVIATMRISEQNIKKFN